MTHEPRPPLILVANNPYGNHLLTSQLLDAYRALDPKRKVILLCNGVADSAQHDAKRDSIEVASFASKRWGALSYLNLVLKLILLRREHPRAAFHLRGFIAGLLFCVSRLCFLGGDRYIYDPRGAFFIEWREAGRPKTFSRLFGRFERLLVKHSAATIVTSERFGDLYKQMFGCEDKYLTIYNSTSFPFAGIYKKVPTEGPVRLVYLGTFNHWHDIDEVARVMASAVHQIGPARSEIYIYTSVRLHSVARQKFGGIGCASLHVGYVDYHDIPGELADKHIGVSVVRPTPSAAIASPIKVADYVANGLLPLLNSGIGDFDPHYVAENSAILYRYGHEVDMTGFETMDTAANKKIYDLVSRAQSSQKLAPIVERLHHD